MTEAKRISNKQIADKLDTLISILTAQAMESTTPISTAVIPAEQGEVKVDAAYMAHMTAKAADHATLKGEEVVLYGRKNKAGETKLAYALRTRYDEVVAKQPSNLGPVGSFQP